jgi:DNA-binding CsgD family transcriptional regulator
LPRSEPSDYRLLGHRRPSRGSPAHRPGRGGTSAGARSRSRLGRRPRNLHTVGLLHARALLALDPGEAAGRFDEALGTDLTHWPLQRARLLLAYGQWLRRQRRIADSRGPLRDARDAFDAMGCAAWGDQARRELRASGESSRRRDLAARDQLTAQELQIAQLAAQGLSNRDIAQRLYLSHRTISTHLYRIFPKLGITSRGELRSALNLTGDAGAEGEVF